MEGFMTIFMDVRMYGCMNGWING
jgi:hypothetical protein